METLALSNPWAAPIYHVERTTSTMDEARALSAAGAIHGTVVVADIQESGRGRVRGRPWTSPAGENLLCTTILRYSDFSAIPTALPLRVGLAVACAVEDVAPQLSGRILVKWPNDVLAAPERGVQFGARKLCGILCESDGKNVFVGVGINTAQKDFPPELSAKATSIALESPAESPDRFAVLECFLKRFKNTLTSDTWIKDLQSRLFRLNTPVRFMDGQADSGRVVEGILSGIGKDGELLLLLNGEDSPRKYLTGELLVYDR